MQDNDESELYRVEVSHEANNRMYDHFEFLARVSENAANQLLEGLMRDIESLKTNPYIYPIYDRPYLPYGVYRYILSCRRYRIIYKISDRIVFVDDIEDCRQDSDKSVLFPD